MTAILGGAFVGAILVLQAVLAPMTGNNAPAVASSTLVVAALFQPVRGRIQTLTDRRFNRSRFDAQHTAETFASRIRDELDLGRLRDEVARIVDETVQPAPVAVWLRATPSAATARPTRRAAL